MTYSYYDFIIIPLIDFIILPIYLAIFFGIAIKYRNKHYRRDHPWRPYFIPALTFKILGALVISFVFTYYYPGGDTVNIFENAYTANKSFDYSFGTWLDLILHRADQGDPRYYELWEKLYFYKDPATFTVCAITAVLNLFTFNSFIITACLFAFLSFWGVWALFRAFVTLYPNLTKPMALATLFIPSLIVWGSGIFKDTVCLFALSWLFYCIVRLMAYKDYRPKIFIIAIINFLLLIKIKIYIAMAFIPALLLWIFFYYSRTIKNWYGRQLAKVVFIVVIFGTLTLALSQFSEDLGRYSLENIAQTSATTRDYINWVSETEGGSSYSLGDVGSGIGGLLTKIPAAINVTLFRPYPWEARKPIVAITALEALLFLFLTLKIIYTVGLKKIWATISADPTIQFCLVFTLIFAFAVGISSYNFGTLSRYKIPCMPFYAVALIVIYYKNKRPHQQLIPFLKF